VIHRQPVWTVALVALALLLAAAGARPASGAVRLGAVSDITWGVPAADVPVEIAMMQQTGISTARLHVSWRQVEDVDDVLNAGALAYVDSAVAAAQAAGLDVLITYTPPVPYWASADPSKHTDDAGRHWNPYYRPERTADFADFVRRATAHFDAMGVRQYEIWNEPNLQRFWPSGVSAAEFAAFQRAGADAVRSVDPDATVVLGGLSKSDYDYLDALYEAGARGSFDVVAVHPYLGSNAPGLCWRRPDGRRAIDALCALEEVRATMVAHGDGDRPVWATEFGYSTSTAAWSVTEHEQARYLVEALDAMGAYPWLERTYLYAFRNPTWLGDDPSDWEANVGLVRTDFSPKPALGAVGEWSRRVARRARLRAERRRLAERRRAAVRRRAARRR
jgi:hypothetical protein